MHRTVILPGYWSDRLTVNAVSAVFHQWEQLQDSGCIENFRIAAGESEGFREGWFFADSDAYKWLDAAARIHATKADDRLAALMDDFIELIGRTQESDGYIYTYNQALFPGSRWTNLQIEHELYCHGHLIEAGVSHFEATGRSDLLEIAIRAADRIVKDFSGKGPKHTPGHQEIEIALLRLFEVTNKSDYLELARQLIEQRGRQKRFWLSILAQNAAVGKREKSVKARKQAYTAAHPAPTPFSVPKGNAAVKPWSATLRWMLSALKGKYFQQHAPVRNQTVPVGHSVRFAYLETAIARLARESGDQSFLPTLERAWERMVTRRMFVTGGIGSLPAMEGFGRDYELDPEMAYAETCAALGSMFWCWEMTRLTGRPQYSDLFEWQLYNASSVGMGINGTTYFYNNPLACKGNISRQAWYEIPCCPSNISRTWADLGKYLFTIDDDHIWVHQYISNETVFTQLDQLKLKVETELPWAGKTRFEVLPRKDRPLTFHFRIPSWACEWHVKVNGEEVKNSNNAEVERQLEQTACGYDPRKSQFLSIQRDWAADDVVEIEFELKITLRHAHPRVKGHKNKAAITRGPLVYCLENVDNPDIDPFNACVDMCTLSETYDRDTLGGTSVITGKTDRSLPVRLIPYHLWGNRGPSEMTVWVNELDGGLHVTK